MGTHPAVKAIWVARRGVAAVLGCARSGAKHSLKFLAAGLIAAVVATAAAAPNSAPAKKEEGFQTSVPRALLMDADSNNVLYDKNGDQITAPASLAKLMTSEVVFNEIKEGRLKLDTEFTVSENAWRKGGAPSHTTSMFVPIHSEAKVEDLMRGVIVQSANDASIALAEGIAENETAFAEMMTKRAHEIGLTKSAFTNSTGLPDPGLKVTARELAKLAQHIIQTYPEFYKIYSEREFMYNRIRQPNPNPLLAMGIGADGLKSGFSEEAGYNLVGSAVQNGLRLIVVISGAKTPHERAEEAKKLLEWGFRSFESRVLFAEGDTVGEAKVYGGSKGHVPLVSLQPVKLMVPRGLSEKIIARIVYTGPVPAPVQQGQVVGMLKVWRGDSLALEVPLQASENVGVGNLSQRAFDAMGELVISVFRAGAERL
jgi:serine-type D-Ala-D-Ala carboxypeptidase (penicillin-binding protein 5/6)